MTIDTQRLIGAFLIVSAVLSLLIVAFGARLGNRRPRVTPPTRDVDPAEFFGPRRDWDAAFDRELGGAK